MKQQRARVKVLIAVHIATVVAIVLLFLMFSPPARKLNRARSESAGVIESLEKENEIEIKYGSTELADKLDLYRGCLAEYDSLVRYATGRQQAGKVVKKLFRAADKINVKVEYIETGLAGRNELYSEIPVNMTVTGGYGDIEDYIRSIEEFREYFRIDRIRFDSKGTGSSDIGVEMMIKVMVREGW